jgi:hypothetical protein
MRVPYFFVWMAAVVASSAFGEDTYRVVEVKKGGRIAGVVKMIGDLPPAEMVEVTKDEAVCGSSHPLEDFVVDAKSRGVQNVVVAIVDIAAGKDFEQTSELVISQEECLYVPCEGIQTEYQIDGAQHRRFAAHHPRVLSRRREPL